MTGADLMNDDTAEFVSASPIGHHSATNGESLDERSFILLKILSSFKWLNKVTEYDIFQRNEGVNGLVTSDLVFLSSVAQEFLFSAKSY